MGYSIWRLSTLAQVSLQWYTIPHFIPMLLYPIIMIIIIITVFLRAAPSAYGASQDRGLIRAVATSWRHSHSNAWSEPRLWPTPQLTAMLDP